MLAAASCQLPAAGRRFAGRRLQSSSVAANARSRRVFWARRIPPATRCQSASLVRAGGFGGPPRGPDRGTGDRRLAAGSW